MKRIFLKTVLAVAALAAAGVAQAQTRTIKFANQNAKGHPIVLGMERFAEIVEQKSGGKLKVQVYPGGALGSDQANLSALQGGTLEMASMNSGILTPVSGLGNGPGLIALTRMLCGAQYAAKWRVRWTTAPLRP